MITAREYAQRRQRILKAIGEGSVAIIPAAQEKLRNGDVSYRYRQDSNFHYVTGFPEPEAVAVLIPGRGKGEYVLFNRQRDRAQETWFGPCIGQGGAYEHYGVNEAFPISQIEKELPRLLQSCKHIYYPFRGEASFERRLRQWRHEAHKQVRAYGIANALFDIEPILSEMRLYKSQAEVDLMAKAAQFSVTAHKRVMGLCKQASNEKEIEAEFLYAIAADGCRDSAYPSIVASGKNACILHYQENNAPLKAGELLLIDAGAEYQHYAADITRTYPIRGHFSSEQRAIYEWVLRAQLAAIDRVVPGTPYNLIQDTIVKIMTEGLCELGILKGRVQDLLEQRAYQRFYMHSSGHWLGIDVHDVGCYKINEQWRSLDPGMVLTVEPGIYIGPDCSEVESKWRGIGIRIEDDILVTETGCQVLSGDLPKTISSLENLVY